MTNADRPAHPIGELRTLLKDPGLNETQIAQLVGFTKREYIAVLAMQAVMSRGAGFQIAAQHAVAAADALLEELAKYPSVV